MVPTIRDVAERAGVSISTVSRVLNKSAAVHQAKRARVEAVAAELGYRPNPAAAALRGRSAGGIGVLLPFVAGEFFSRFLEGIDGYTSDKGLFLMVSSSHRSVGEFKTILQRLDRRVDGLIVMSTEASAADVIGWASGALPLVFVNTDTAGVDVEAVNFDNRGGAAAMADHLVAQGHRRIAFLSGPDGSYDAAERRAGFVGALARHGLELALELPGDYRPESGEAAVPALLAADPRPTAIFAANDGSACGLLTGLRDAGVEVPGGMAVAGFDDVPVSRLASPTITSVHVPIEEIGRVAIERLAAKIDGSATPSSRVTTLPTHVVERESTAR